MLATSLFPSAYCRQTPHIGHLLTPIQFFHQVIVEFMGNILLFSCPDNKLSRVFDEIKLNGKFLIYRNFLGVLIFYICDFLDNALLGNAYVRLPKGNQQRL